MYFDGRLFPDTRIVAFQPYFSCLKAFAMLHLCKLRERSLGRKIIKLPDDAEISKIERQNTKAWEPAKFFTQTELKTAIDAVLTPVVAKPPPEDKPAPRRARRPERAKPETAENQVAPPPDQPRRRRRRRRRSAAAAEPQGGEAAVSQETPKRRRRQPKRHPFHSLMAVIRALHSDRFLHRDLCGNSDDYKDYEQYTLAKVDEIISSLEAMTARDAEKEEAWRTKHFIPLLDELSRFYSSAAQIAHSGNRSAIALKNDLEARLYGSIDISCRDLGWFKIQEVHPFVEKFNHFLPQHNLVGTVDAGEELKDIILQVHNIGMMDPQGKSFIEEAKVIIGGDG